MARTVRDVCLEWAGYLEGDWWQCFFEYNAFLKSYLHCIFDHTSFPFPFFLELWVQNTLLLFLVKLYLWRTFIAESLYFCRMIKSWLLVATKDWRWALGALSCDSTDGVHRKDKDKGSHSRAQGFAYIIIEYLFVFRSSSVNRSYIVGSVLLLRDKLLNRTK